MGTEAEKALTQTYSWSLYIYVWIYQVNSVGRKKVPNRSQHIGRDHSPLLQMINPRKEGIWCDKMDSGTQFEIPREVLLRATACCKVVGNEWWDGCMYKLGEPAH